MKKLITQLKQEKNALEQQAKKQYMGYQAEIQKAIQRIETLEQKISEKDERIIKLDKVVQATFTLASGGEAQTHVGTGGGGNSSDMPWNDKERGRRR